MPSAVTAPLHGAADRKDRRLVRVHDCLEPVDAEHAQVAQGYRHRGGEAGRQPTAAPFGHGPPHRNREVFEAEPVGFRDARHDQVVVGGDRQAHVAVRQAQEAWPVVEPDAVHARHRPQRRGRRLQQHVGQRYPVKARRASQGRRASTVRDTVN